MIKYSHKGFYFTGNLKNAKTKSPFFYLDPDSCQEGWVKQ